MRNLLAAVAAALLLATASFAQQPPPAAAPPPGSPAGPPAAKMPEPPITIWRVDLVPVGYGFAMDEPVLEGDVWVFRSLPDRTLEHVPKSKVKSISRWSTDYDKEVVFQVDFVPTGSVLVREEPLKKGRGYTLTTWRQGTLLSVKEEDVKKISRLTGFPAFKAEMTELGVTVLEHDTTHEGFNRNAEPPRTIRGPASGAPASPGSPASPGNWTYQGAPGSSDAYAPGSGTVSKPGDTPMMPQPTRPPQ